MVNLKHYNTLRVSMYRSNLSSVSLLPRPIPEGVETPPSAPFSAIDQSVSYFLICACSLGTDKNNRNTDFFRSRPGQRRRKWASPAGSLPEARHPGPRNREMLLASLRCPHTNKRNLSRDTHESLLTPPSLDAGRCPSFRTDSVLKIKNLAVSTASTDRSVSSWKAAESHDSKVEG